MSASEDAGLLRRWIVKFLSVGGGNETFFISHTPRRRVLRTLSESSKGKIQRRQYLLVGVLRLLQMVLEPDTGRCASEEVEPRRGWT